MIDDSASSLSGKKRQQQLLASSIPAAMSHSGMLSPSASLIHTTTTNTNDRSVFSPVMTPTPTGQSIMLLSPSRTITETLSTLASSTGRQLEEIWDEVGYSPEDRAAQLSDLVLQFRNICEQQVSDEKEVLETFRQTILESREEISRTAKALKIDEHDDAQHPDRSSSMPALTLTDELAKLDAKLEGLRATASAAKEDLQRCREDIVEAHEALGLDMDPKYDDIESDLTTRRREVFHVKKAEMKHELSTRMSAIVQIVRDCQILMDELRMEPEVQGTEFDQKIAGSLVRSKDGTFIMASKFPSESCVGIGSGVIEKLTQRVGSLQDEKRRRKEKLQEMGSEIAILWEKLRVSDEEQLAFTKSVQGLGTETISKGNHELVRLHKLKSDMLGNLIEEARVTIADLWDQINAPQQSQDSFAAFSVKEIELFNDSLLEKHEEYIATLQAQLEQMKPILRIIERREAVVRERFEYDNIQKDSDRLNQRGAALTKQLMAEEKMAKRIKRDLPKLSELLEQKLKEWLTVHDEHFKFNGESYLNVMEQQENEWNQYKEKEQQRKLKKKQVEKSLVDNSRSGARPLGQSHRHNTAKLGKQQSSAVAEGKVRTLGNKQSSARQIH